MKLKDVIYVDNHKSSHECFSWFENNMNGYIQLFGRVTFWGENAMHWAITIRMFGYGFHFRPPFKCFNQKWPIKIYVSKDGTPSNAIWGIGHSNRRVWGFKMAMMYFVKNPIRVLTGKNNN